MTLDEAVARTGAQFDVAFARQQDQQLEIMIACGMSLEDADDFLALRAEQYAVERAALLAKLRRELLDPNGWELRRTNRA